MKKHRKWLIPIVIIVAIVLLSAISHSAVLDDVCAVNDYYIIMRDGDGYKLLLTEHGRTFDSGSAFFGPLIFDSVQQMKYKLLTGEFTQKEASYIKQLDPGGGLYKYCIDFDDLYDVVLPEGALPDRIAWGGSTYYHLYFTHAISSSADYIIRVESSRFRHFREYVNKESYESIHSSITYLKQEQLSDRNATAHYFQQKRTPSDPFKEPYTTAYTDLWYELSSGNKTIYVQERFQTDVYNTNGAPYEINILGKQGEYYYNLHFEDLESRPTEDWLLSFGLKPYVESE